MEGNDSLVTLKLYLENPYLREVEARLLSSFIKDGNYHLELDRTIFFPRSLEDKIFDKGTINGLELIDVYEKNNKIIHVTKKDLSGERVHLCLDWNHRLLTMQYHTGRHILLSSISKLFAEKPIGFGFNKDHAYLDLSKNGLSQSQVSKLESYSNKIIWLNFPLSSYSYKSSKEEKLVRIVEIDPLESFHCRGVHLRSTGEVGLLKITKTQVLEDSFRIYYMVGSQAFNLFQKLNKASLDLMAYSNLDSLDLPGSIYSLIEENISLRSKLDDYLNMENKKYGENLLINANILGDAYLIRNTIYNKTEEDMVYISNFINKDNLLQLYGLYLDEGPMFIVKYGSRFKDIDYSVLKKDFNFTIKSYDPIIGSIDIKELDPFLGQLRKLYMDTFQ